MSGIVPPILTTPYTPPVETPNPTTPPTTPPTTICSPWCPTTSTTAWQPPTSTWEPPPTTLDPPKSTRPQPTRNPTTPPVASTQRPITNSLPGPGVPSQSNPNTPSASISSNLPTTRSDAEGGLTQGAVIGIVIVSLAVVGIIVSFFVIRHTRRRNHKPLYPEGDDFLSHLPIDGPNPPPPMSHKPNYLHHSSGHYPNDQDGGEYDPMYHQGDYHHGGGDGHHDYYQDQGYGDQGGYGHDGQYQGFSDQGHGFSDQGQAHHGGDGQFDHLNQGHGHQGGGGDGYQGFSDTGHHGGGGDGQFQGFSDQGTTHGFDQGGANQVGGGTQDPGSQGFSNQGPSGTFQTTPQPTSGPGGSNGLGGGFQNNLPGGNQTSLPDNPFQNIGQGYPSGQPSQQPGSMSSSGGLPILPPLAPAPPLINRPKTGSVGRPESSSTYSVLMPSSPSTHSVDLGHIDEAGEDSGYSPRSKQALLDQTRYHDGISTQHPNPRVLTPKIATIPSTQVHEARAPQLRDSETVGAILTTGNASSLNTFDRRHPQSHESDSARDSLFFDPSTNVRGPQDL